MRRLRWWGGLTVHPRVCGEHVKGKPQPRLILGSSPRVRGTSINQDLLGIIVRFIPACAGNMPQAPRPCIAASVHPRVCGEHLQTRALVALLIGSSPRVRGTSTHNECNNRVYRFIPACAGNMSSLPPLEAIIPVHPRVCGEHRTKQRLPSPSSGSSPRVRGTLRDDYQTRMCHRFIPACAGNMPMLERMLHYHLVHPRVCGEHLMAWRSSSGSPGSSPRVRGT